MKEKSYKRSKQISNLIVHIVLAILAFIWVFPVLWVVMTSFRAEKGSYVSTFFPKSYTLDNYIKLFTDTTLLNFPKMFMNTLVIAVFSCLLSTFLLLSVSYCLSRMKFKMRKPYMNMAMVLGLFPGFMSMIAVYYILKGLGLLVLAKADVLKFTSGYSNSKIGRVDKMELDSKYDNFKIRSLGALKMTTGYSNFTIEELKRSFIASDIKYGKININKIATDFSEIDIQAAYTPVTLAITPQHSFRAKLYTHYGNIKCGDLKFHDITFNDENDRFAKSITGIAGPSSSPSAKITISDRYANIVFEK